MSPFPPRWEKVRALGSGGQASVYLVQDRTGELKGEYALKLLSSEKPKQAYARFIKEIDATKKVVSEFVVQVLDHSQPDDVTQYYVMEYAKDAKPLRQLMTETVNPFYNDPLKAMDFAIELFTAMSAWEEKGIVHRDLSPNNVLILPNSSIRVIDFGICQTENGETISLLDEGFGTRNYAAPETESGTRGVITIMADIYSAGKLVWSAITNRQAFAREQSGLWGPNSVRSIFPTNPETWHLQHIFENTIRHAPTDRWPDTTEAIVNCFRIRKLVQIGFEPLEGIVGDPEYIRIRRCRTCGVGTLDELNTTQNADDARIRLQLLGNPTTANYSAWVCNYCGHCSVFSLRVSRGIFDKRKQLS